MSETTGKIRVSAFRKQLDMARSKIYVDLNRHGVVPEKIDKRFWLTESQLESYLLLRSADTRTGWWRLGRKVMPNAEPIGSRRFGSYGTFPIYCKQQTDAKTTVA